MSGTVGSRERLRLFCALTLPEPALDGIVAWQAREVRDSARAVPRENLHATLAFLGDRPPGDVERIAAELRLAAAAVSEPLSFRPGGYRETRSVGMLVLHDDGGRASLLAADVHERLTRLGVYEPEERIWLPHVTVLRFRRPPRLRPSLPDFAAFSPSGAAVYHSVLRSSGAQYEVLEFVSLGG